MANACGLSADTKRKKVIFCCDPGGDDAAALILLLRNPDRIEILAIAINAGNTNVRQGMTNALRILKLMNRLDIPVYKGHDNILNNDKLLNSDNFFGNDAFGDFTDGTVFDYTPYTQRSENAIQVMRRLVSQYPNEITLFAVSPLTSLAYLLKEDPDIGGKFKETLIMGGNYKGVGNITPAAEFNFYYDPEAANEVMTRWKSDICLVTWELCLSAAQPWDWYDLKFVRKPNRISTFLKNVFNQARIKTSKKKYVPCDELAASLLINSKIVSQCKPIECCVECTNDERRGANVVNWSSQKQDKNIYLVTEVDVELLKECLLTSTND